MSVPIKFLIIFASGALVTFLLTPAAIKIAPRIGAMDIPRDSRRMHDKPIPRFGGSAIFAGVILGAAVGILIVKPITKRVFIPQTAGLLAGAVMIFLLGVIDDLKNLSPKVKLAGQILCASAAWFTSVRIHGLNFPFEWEYRAFSVPLSFLLTVFWIVAITNTINLVDGLDGLASGIVLIACVSIGYTSYYAGNLLTCVLIIATGGAALGFLFWNFYPAKIFMGDAGSMLLGYLLSTVSLIGDSPAKGTTLFASIVPVLILALPIFDICYAVVRRAAKHQPIMKADKGHLHHRIMAMGFGQRRTVLVLYSISGIMGVAGVLWTVRRAAEAVALALIAGTLVFIFLGTGIVDKKIEKKNPEESAKEQPK